MKNWKRITLFVTLLVLSQFNSMNCKPEGKRKKDVNSALKLVTYIDAINDVLPIEALCSNLAIPSYTEQNPYNILIHSFWLSSGPADAAKIWNNPIQYLSANNPFGTTNAQIQQNIAQIFHNNGKLLLVSAFGATEKPTSEGK